MSIQQAFKKFNENIRLTKNQENDAKVKYDGVCKKVHDFYYPTCAYDGGTKFLFGSYKKKTNTRPFSKDQDVDVLLKLPIEVYEKFDAYKSNGQSALLQEIRGILKEKYTTTDKIKAWGKVILVEFWEWWHNIELLPAFEQEDESFLIPNSETATWDSFNPREDIQIFTDSNKKQKGLTVELVRMVKTWKKQNTSLELKSYQIEQYVMSFLSLYDMLDKDYIDIVYTFFRSFLLSAVWEEGKTYVQSAIDRFSKAKDFIENEDIDSASRELKKVFGSEFPIAESKNQVCESRQVSPPKLWKLF